MADNDNEGGEQVKSSMGDFGTWVAFVGGGIMAAAVIVHRFMITVWDTIGASLKAIIKTTAVWTGVLVLTFGGFWLGCMQDNHTKRMLRSQIAELRSNLNTEREARAAEKARADTAEAALNKAGPSGSTETAKSAPVAPAPKRQVAKAPLKKQAASEPAKGWWPFAN